MGAVVVAEFLESKSDFKTDRILFAAVLAQLVMQLRFEAAKEAEKSWLGGVAVCHLLDRNATTGGGRLLRCFGWLGELLGSDRAWFAAT